MHSNIAIQNMASVQVNVGQPTSTYINNTVNYTAVPVGSLCVEKYIKVSDLPKIIKYITEAVCANLAFNEEDFLSMISGE